MTQGTCNGGDRGNSKDRRARKEWLVLTYRADRDVIRYYTTNLGKTVAAQGPVGTGQPACRCYRCGALLTVDTVTPDRIIPGCQGGTYRRNNIRPACSTCQSITGNEIKHALYRKTSS